jgi:shikimate dehydrogenase
MQNAGFAALGLNWRYLAHEVRPEHLREAMAGARRMNYSGLNLTVPHKVLAMDLVDVLDEAAETWGAVNTVLFEGRDAKGQWRPLRDYEDAPAETRSRGFNTDADAIPRAIREDLALDLAGSKVLLLGAGGAGRTAALRLAAEGVRELWMVNRTATKAATIGEEIKSRYPQTNCHLGYPTGNVDLVINATSLGLAAGDGLPLEQRAFPLDRAGAAFDMIYRPAETPFLRLARTCGRPTANGLAMLLYQGAKALEIWTGQAAPIGPMRQALEANIYG